MSYIDTVLILETGGEDVESEASMGKRYAHLYIYESYCWLYRYPFFWIFFFALSHNWSGSKLFKFCLLDFIFLFIICSHKLSRSLIDCVSVNEDFYVKLLSLFYRKNVRERLIFPVQQRYWITRLSSKLINTKSMR